MDKVRQIKLFKSLLQRLLCGAITGVRDKINFVLRMDTKKKEAIMACETFDDLLNAEYGERGAAAREKFEAEAETFCLAECLKEQRRLAGLTQEQLATKIGTKKSYISKIENGHADIQLSTLFRIFSGLGKRVSLSIL